MHNLGTPKLGSIGNNLCTSGICNSAARNLDLLRKKSPSRAACQTFVNGIRTDQAMNAQELHDLFSRGNVEGFFVLH
jgi:hypothetical protein